VNHLKGGCPNTNAQYLRHILESKLSGPFSQVILFNAAFAGMIYHDLSFENAYSHAQESLSSGAALKKYHEVKKT
jgi:anthranilate phosphoribosyltransferase